MSAEKHIPLLRVCSALGRKAQSLQPSSRWSIAARPVGYEFWCWSCMLLGKLVLQGLSNMKLVDFQQFDADEYIGYGERPGVGYVLSGYLLSVGRSRRAAPVQRLHRRLRLGVQRPDRAITGLCINHTVDQRRRHAHQNIIDLPKGKPPMCPRIQPFSSIFSQSTPSINSRHDTHPLCPAPGISNAFPDPLFKFFSRFS